MHRLIVLERILDSLYQNEIASNMENMLRYENLHTHMFLLPSP